MTIAAGTRLGPYEIIAPIGAGGMGEVYKARDTRLERAVAVKILPTQLASNAQFKIRFNREAKTISQLSHPNICTLYDVGENYLVMELLEGETLADRLARGSLPLTEVLKYGGQIAEALGKAHREGVVHRDLKPGNVMITKSGAKLLDFGLAKSVAASFTAPDSATAQRPVTQEGMVVGTLQYMAPEQLTGEEPDERTDIFALGALLYEMATGKRAFEGKTKTSLIGAIVSGEPKPMHELQPLTPPALEHVVKKCLAKDPDDRWQSASDIGEELRWIGEAGSQAGIALPITMREKTRERLTLAVAALLAIAVAVIAPLYWRAASRKEPLVHLAIPISGDVAEGAFVSPDASRLVISIAGKLWLRRLDAADAVPLAGTEGAFLPFWSPDGKFVAFFADQKLKKTPADGGPVEILSDVKNPRGGTWGRNGTILFAPDIFTPLYKVPQSGGTPVAVTSLSRKSETSHRLPQFLPDGRHFIYTVFEKQSDGTDRPSIMGASLDSPAAKRIVQDAAQAFYAAPGWLVFARGDGVFDGGTLIAIRFDPDTLNTSGEPMSVPVAKVANTLSAWVYRYNAANGTLVYRQWSPPPKAQLRWVDRDGKTIADEGEPVDVDLLPALSPDARRIALVRDRDLWIHDVGTTASSRFTFDGLDFNADPVWSFDGKRLFFESYKTVTRTTLRTKSLAGSGKEEDIYSGAFLQDFAVSPDGRTILLAEQVAGNGYDILSIDLSTHRAQAYVGGPGSQSGPAFSPDGKWVGYRDRSRIMVRRFPDNGEQWQVSDQRGSLPKWSRDGKNILYVAKGQLMSVPVKLGATVEAGTPKELFTCDGYVGQSPDGKRFLTLVNEKNTNASLQVVLNWPRMLERK